MQRGLQGAGPCGHTQLDRDAVRALSVRDVACAGGAGYAEVAAGTGRLRRAVGMNSKQNVSHKNQGVRRIRLDN